MLGVGPLRYRGQSDLVLIISSRGSISESNITLSGSPGTIFPISVTTPVLRRGTLASASVRYLVAAQPDERTHDGEACGDNTDCRFDRRPKEDSGQVECEIRTSNKIREGHDSHNTRNADTVESRWSD